MDADFSHLPSFIPKLYSYKSNDIVIASRYIDGGIQIIIFLKFLSRVLNFMELFWDYI